MLCRIRRFVFLKNIKKLVFAALMTALCVIIGWFCKTYFTFGAIRITFENVPVLLAGMLLGPAFGAAVGVASDIVSRMLSGFGVNPIITLGSASVGVIAGLLHIYIIKRKGFLPTALSVLTAHAVGSMLIKSVGLYFYGYALPILLTRVPLFLGIGLAESYLIWLLLKNKRISSAFERNGVRK